MRSSYLCAFGAALLLALAPACSDSGGGTEVRCVSLGVIAPSGDTVGIVALRAPVLLGSIVKKSEQLGELNVTLEATVDDVTVRVEAARGVTKTITLDAVEAGAFDEDAPLVAEGRGGASYELVLTPSCS